MRQSLIRYALVAVMVLTFAMANDVLACSTWKIDNIFEPVGCVDLYKLTSEGDGVCVYSLHSTHC